MKRNQSKKHKLGAYEIDKISLSCFDDNDDGIRMLAYFHKDSIPSCKQIEEDCDKKDCNKENFYN